MHTIASCSRSQPHCFCTDGCSLRPQAPTSRWSGQAHAQAQVWQEQEKSAHASRQRLAQRNKSRLIRCMVIKVGAHSFHTSSHHCHLRQANRPRPRAGVHRVQKVGGASPAQARRVDHAKRERCAHGSCSCGAPSDCKQLVCTQMPGAEVAQRVAFHTVQQGMLDMASPALVWAVAVLYV